MDFLRNYFFKIESLIIWAFLSSKLDFITGESNFDERDVKMFILKETTS